MTCATLPGPPALICIRSVPVRTEDTSHVKWIGAWVDASGVVVFLHPVHGAPVTHRRRRYRLAPALGVVVLAACAPAWAALPQQTGNVDLLTQANITFTGALPEDFLGGAVAPAGDLNHDGIDDIAISAPGADVNGVDRTGSVYVIFGSRTPVNIDVASLGNRGVRIDGAAMYDSLGKAMASVGDVNGDGIDDLAIGARANNNNFIDSGSVYLIYGSRSLTDINLAALGSRGVRIDGAGVDDRAGEAVAGVGDVNRDGLDDFVIGAQNARPRTETDADGAAYVIYGSRSLSNLYLGDPLGTRGFRISGAANGDMVGWSVAGPGDLNNDGTDDIAVGATHTDYNGRSTSGSVYVIYGAPQSSTIDLAAPLGAKGVRFDGASASEFAGGSVAGAGDVNRDGTDDLVIGAAGANHNSRTGAGSAYVIYGSSSLASRDLSMPLGNAGIRIDGSAQGEAVGAAVDGARDVDGDGLSDLVVGASGADYNGRTDSGSVYVVYGSATPTNVDLAAPVNTRVRRIDGSRPGEGIGRYLAFAGDVNGDGRPDIVTGSPAYDDAARTGAAYVTFGFGPASISYAVPSSAITGAVTLTPTVARTGSASYRTSTPLPTGLTLNETTGVITGTPTGTRAITTHTITQTDLTGTASTTITLTTGNEPPASPAPSPVAAPTPAPAPLVALVTPVRRTAKGTEISLDLSTTTRSTVYITLPGGKRMLMPIGTRIGNRTLARKARTTVVPPLDKMRITIPGKTALPAGTTLTIVSGGQRQTVTIVPRKAKA